MAVISFTRVSKPFGWLSNMAPYPIPFNNQLWNTAEALFQALRFGDAGVKEKIRAQKSPMAARFVAKNRDNKQHMIVVPHSERDKENMRFVINLKFTHYPKLADCLIKTFPHDIIENCSLRGDTFWGARKIGEHWFGENNMGNLLMDLRDELIAASSAAGGDVLQKEK